MFLSRIRADAGGGDRSPSGDFWFEPLGGRTSSGARVTSTTAMGLPAVWACVNVLAKSFAVMPFNLWEPAELSRKKRTDHWLYKLVCKAPNRFQPPFMWRQMIMGHLALRGNAYNQITEGRNGEISELLPLHPDRMKMELLDNGSYRYRYTDQNGREIIYLRTEIWHIRGLSNDGFMGLSPIEVAREAVGEGLAMQGYSSRFYGNDARPRGVVQFDGRFADKAARQTFRESWQEAQGGRNVGKVAVLEKGMTYQELKLTNADSQFLENRAGNLSEVARIFGIPPHKIGDLARCMPGSTLVFTSEGPKRIDAVLPGEKVWSPTTAGPSLRTVLNHWDNGIRETLEIRTTNRTVRCTENHRLLVRRAVERDLNPGERGGRNVGGAKRRIVWRNEFVAAGELKTGDMLVTLDRITKQGTSAAPNGRALTAGFMEFAGLLMADGNITYEGGKPRGAQIARGDKANYMEPYRQTMREEFVRYPVCGRASALAIDMEPVSIRESCRQTVFSSVQAGQELLSLGFGGTAFTKRIPGWVFGLEEELRLAFLRGFLDGDGTVDAKGRIVYYSANKALLDDVRHLCMSAGIPVTNTRSDVNGEAAFGNGTRMWRFTCSDPGANVHIGSHDARYVARFKRGKAFGKKDRSYPRFGGKDFTAPGLALSKIVSIDARQAEPVYDIEVEGEHCFFADGVASHNSTNNNIEHQSIEFWTDAMHPLGCCVASSMEFDLLGPDSNLDCEFDIRPMMRGDGKSRSERLNRLVLGGILKPNEGRAEEGYDPTPGGDTLLRPLNMGTVNEDGEVEAPDAPDGADPEDVPGGPTEPGGESPDGTDRAATEARMAALLSGNASRMARRIAGGSYPTAEVLAEAMAIDRIEARRWIQRGWSDVPEDEIAADLMTLAGAPQIDQTASAIRSLATAIAERKPAQINVAPAAVTVQPAAVNVTVEPAQISVESPTVNLPAPVVNLPAPIVNVEVKPADVTVQAAPAPVVNMPAPVVNVEVQPAPVHIAQQPAPSGGQQARPWPTETVIKVRDKQGRADVIETRPIDE